MYRRHGFSAVTVCASRPHMLAQGAACTGVNKNNPAGSRGVEPMVEVLGFAVLSGALHHEQACQAMQNGALEEHTTDRADFLSLFPNFKTAATAACHGAFASLAPRCCGAWHWEVSKTSRDAASILAKNKNMHPWCFANVGCRDELIPGGCIAIAFRPTAQLPQRTRLSPCGAPVKRAVVAGSGRRDGLLVAVEREEHAARLVEAVGEVAWAGPPPRAPESEHQESAPGRASSSRGGTVVILFCHPLLTGISCKYPGQSGPW